VGLLKLLFILAIFLFTFGEVIRVPFAGLSIKLIDIGVIVLVFYWILFIIKNFKKIKINKDLGIPILIFSTIVLFSLLLNSRLLSGKEFFVSFLYLIRWISYASIAFIIPMFNSSFKIKIKNLLVSVGSLVVILGFIQYLFYPNLRNLYYLGWDEHLYRMFSVFLDPNFAGAFFSLYFFLIAEITYSFIKKRELFKIAIFGLLGLLTFIAIFLTYSRSAILMLIIGSLTFLFLEKKRFIAIILVLLVFISIFLAPKAFKTEGTDLFRKVSSEARISSAKQAISVFAKNPVMGIGFNSYKFARFRYGFSARNDPSHAEGGTDVSLLFVLVTTGLVGFVAYIFLLSRIILLSYKKIKSTYIAKVLFVSIVALIVNSFFINSLFYSFFMVWIWVLVGLLPAGREVTENK